MACAQGCCKKEVYFGGSGFPKAKSLEFRASKPGFRVLGRLLLLLRTARKLPKQKEPPSRLHIYRARMAEVA